ncbi:heat-inducible transcriptional repressor HrcA [Nitrospina watsonii]|uniref:Heat-inducible transcription repressor HrcA n=1 Tax=Nitrospina watsonii TaxID=1323948 RepID=A0ABM9HEW6_9BACT|nr:heat-inducible transcriptional repressor HrcA [Nitrospina watsonii]CAI2718780.1 Heat-inducible transcription repressor HrcA [Nitrospina watsonii]
MPPTPLDDRSRTILMETVSNYIATAEPVGSRTISHNLQQRLSPATVRNVMADLEEMGHLHQPHTSAGRVPTDQGYRFFVNELLQIQIQNPAPLTGFPHDLKNRSLDEILESACSFLSTCSHQAGLVMVPSFWDLALKNIQFIHLTSGKLLAVFESQMGVLQNKIIETGEAMSQDHLNSVANYLNREFGGRSLKTIRQELLHRKKNEKERYNELMKQASQLWSEMFPDEQNAELLIDGLINLLDQPEFSENVEKMKRLMKTVEEKAKLVKLLDQCMIEDGLTILIGEENLEQEMEGFSLIAQNYRMGGEKLGTLAVFGPKRMDYQKMIGIVNSTATNVSEFLSKQ